LVFDYRQCGFDEADVALCEYSIELTLRPGDSSRANIEKLRAHGFTDEQITVATQVISYFNYINRIADGLGVDPEDWMTVPLEKWLAEKPAWRDVF
jgi:alkylhydroperoxidase family enzyme